MRWLCWWLALFDRCCFLGRENKSLIIQLFCVSFSKGRLSSINTSIVDWAFHQLASNSWKFCSSDERCLLFFLFGHFSFKDSGSSLVQTINSVMVSLNVFEYEIFGLFDLHLCLTHFAGAVWNWTSSAIVILEYVSLEFFLF